MINCKTTVDTVGIVDTAAKLLGLVSDCYNLTQERPAITFSFLKNVTQFRENFVKRIKETM